jgi:type I restriction enzyme S subunit
MMSKYVEKRLGEMIDVNPVVKLTKGETYPFIDIDKVERQNKFVTNEDMRIFDGQGGSKFQNGDTVFSRITPCLENRKIAKVKLNHYTDVGFGSTEFFIFRGKKKLCNNDFAHYLVSSDWVVLPAINSMTGASGRQRADRKFIERLMLKFPDYPTQTRIAEILSAYDDAIENNNRRIAILEKAAEELYKEWFVRFRFPGYKNAKFVNGLPEGWEVERLGIVNITSSKRIYMSDYVDEGIPFYRSKEVIQSVNGEALSEPLFISTEKYKELKEKFGVPCKNDILITSVGTIGVSFLVDDRIFYFKDGNLTWLQSGTTPKLALYIFLWLNSDIGKSTLLSPKIGTSQSALTIENLKRLKFLKPNDIVLESFYNMVMPLVEQKRTLQSQSQNLVRQRDLLLPRLMSGKLEM